MPRCNLARVILLTALVAVLMPSAGAAFGQEATPAPAAMSHPFAGDPAWIAYYGEGGIGLIHPDGTGDHFIDTGVPGESLLANWSPDGTKLVFTTRGGQTEPLYEYDLATGASRQLFTCEDPCIGDDEPVYSPDGSKVLFIRAFGPFTDTGPSDCGLWIGDVATGEVTRLTSNTDPPCDREYSPRFSPDGTQITYWKDPYEDGKPTGTSVWVVDADGTNARQLTDQAMNAGDPDWSPDGEWLVFSTWPLLEYQCCHVSNLYRMRPDGTGMEQLTSYADESLRAAHPRYTPDGEWIVFTSVTPETRSLWAIPAEGGTPVVLVQGGIYTHGTWQPMPAGGSQAVAAASPHAGARKATPATATPLTILDPDEAYAGATLAEWNARWFQWAFSFPVDINPNVSLDADACGYGQAGPVFFLPANFGLPGRTLSCAIPEGVAIFFPVAGSDCSTVEPHPFFGRDEVELRACAANAVDAIPISEMTVTVDGQEVPELGSYRSSSPLTPIDFPPNNYYEVTPGAALFVNDHYAFLIAPPPPGPYEIVLASEAAVLTTYRITIEVPRIIAPNQ